MGKPFAVKSVKDGRFRAISFALDATRPEDYFHDLEADLARLKLDGEVLFDLLACNGHSPRRFFVMRFDGTHLAHHTMRIESESSLDAKTLTFCSAFFSKNFSKLGKTVLSTPALKKLSVTH